MQEETWEDRFEKAFPALHNVVESQQVFGVSMGVTLRDFIASEFERARKERERTEFALMKEIADAIPPETRIEAGVAYTERQMGYIDGLNAARKQVRGLLYIPQTVGNRNDPQS